MNVNSLISTVMLILLGMAHATKESHIDDEENHEQHQNLRAAKNSMPGKVKTVSVRPLYRALSTV